MHALSSTGGLITSAAVMLGTTTFAFVASEVQFIKFIGIGIAISVVIDATVVRMLLVPAVLVVMGDWNWYCPQWLGVIIDFVGVSDDTIELDDFSLDAQPLILVKDVEDNGWKQVPAIEENKDDDIKAAPEYTF